MASWWLSPRFQRKTEDTRQTRLESLCGDTTGMMPVESVGRETSWRPREDRVARNVHLHRKDKDVCVQRAKAETCHMGGPLQRTSTKAMPSRNVISELLQRVPALQCQVELQWHELSLQRDLKLWLSPAIVHGRGCPCHTVPRTHF